MLKIENEKIFIEIEKKYVASNYAPIEVVISKGKGIWVWDIYGNKYIDCLSAYSAVNQGHCHPVIINALIEQTKNITLTSRAFYNERLPIFAQKLSNYCNKDKILPMNTGAEAVETAIKLARKWGYEKKGIKQEYANIITMKNNFHGRTTTIISFSTDSNSKNNFGPYTPGFKTVEFNNITQVLETIDNNTVGILLEPIQGEAGVIIPEIGYLKSLRKICDQYNILLILDEVQTGFCRTGKKFCFMHEEIEPDILIMGKALGGGVYPISAIAANDDIMEVFTPGSHGSTFGGNPLAAAVGIASLEVLEKEKLDENAQKVGSYFLSNLNDLKLKSKIIKDVRGKGLLIGIELDSEILKKSNQTARDFVYKLKERGILAKDTHDWTIRIAPPLIISIKEIDMILNVFYDIFCR